MAVKWKLLSRQLKGDAQVGAEEIGRGQSAGMEQGSVEHPEWIHPNGITFLVVLHKQLR